MKLDFVKALIFDADNTLYKINPKKAYKKQFSYICNILNINVESFKEEYFKTVNKIAKSKDIKKRSRNYSIKKTINNILQLKNNNTESIIKKSLEIFYNELLHSGIEYEKNNVLLIKKLCKKYALFIASDEFQNPLELKLNFVFEDYKKYFKYIVSCDIAGELKPSKKFYEIIIQKFDLKPYKCIMIGDDWERDLNPAKEMKINTVLVNNKKTGNPDYWVNDLCKIEKFL